MGNPAPRLLVPGGRFADVAADGGGPPRPFLGRAPGGVRARAVAFGCDGRVAGDPSAAARRHLQARAQRVERRGRAAAGAPPRPAVRAGADRRCSGSRRTTWPRCWPRSMRPATLEPRSPSRAQRRRPRPDLTRGAAHVLDRRGHSPLAVLVDAVAGGEPVLAVCADVPRRLAGLRARAGGFTLAGYSQLEREPARLRRVWPRRRARSARRRVRRGGAGRRCRGAPNLAWGEPELRFAEQMHELEYGLRASLVAFYRALRARERAAGEELERLLRGDGPHGRPARLAGTAGPGARGAGARQPRPGSAGPGDRGRAPTALERSPSFRVYAQRYEDGKRYLSSANLRASG